MNFFGKQQKQEYRKSLLFEIIFQARFPDNLSIPNETPLDFQSNMRNQGYPNFNVSSAPIQEIFKPDLGVIPKLTNTYIFASADPNRPYQVNLSKNSISLTHFGSYNKGDDFKNRLDNILELFVDIYGLSNFGRLGLRHRNILNESNMPKIIGKDIKSIIPEVVFPELKQSYADEIKSIHKRHTLSDGKISINASYALETVSGIYGQMQLDKQISYFIDIDCFTNQSVRELQDVSEFYGLFIRNYWNAFEWSISKEIRELII